MENQSLCYTIINQYMIYLCGNIIGDAMKSFKIIGVILASLLFIVGLSIGGYKNETSRTRWDSWVVKGWGSQKDYEDDLKEMVNFLW